MGDEHKRLPLHEIAEAQGLDHKTSERLLANSLAVVLSFFFENQYARNDHLILRSVAEGQ